MQLEQTAWRKPATGSARVRWSTVYKCDRSVSNIVLIGPMGRYFKKRTDALIEKQGAKIHTCSSFLFQTHRRVE